MDSGVNSQPAFPVACQDLSKYQVCESGMSLRDWFAGQALSGFTSNPAYLNSAWQLAKQKQISYQDQVSIDTYALADAMILGREKER